MCCGLCVVATVVAHTAGCCDNQQANNFALLPPLRVPALQEWILAQMKKEVRLRELEAQAAALDQGREVGGAARYKGGLGGAPGVSV